MMRRTGLAALLLFALWTAALAKDKKKAVLPADVLRAKTVLVIVDPNAGLDVADPNANRLARVDVEQALDRWGRFSLVQDGYTADLVLLVRKGNGRLVQPTIGGTPVNGDPRAGAGSDGMTSRAGGRWGTSGLPNDPANAGNQPATPYPQVEAGSTEDTLVVYRGSKDNPNQSPLDAPAVWRFTAKDALESPSVPAVDAFRKAIADSEKQLQTGP